MLQSDTARGDFASFFSLGFFGLLSLQFNAYVTYVPGDAFRLASYFLSRNANTNARPGVRVQRPVSMQKTTQRTRLVGRKRRPRWQRKQSALLVSANSHEAVGYTKLVDDVLASFCETALGRAKAIEQAKKPVTSLDHARTLQNETQAALRCMSIAVAALSVSNACTREAHEAIEVSNAGGAASADGLFAVLKLHDAALRVHSSLEEASSAGEDVSALSRRVEHLLKDCSQQLLPLKRCLDDENARVADNATTRLTEARRRLRKARSRALEAVVSAVGSAASSSVEERNGRMIALLSKSDVKKNHLIASLEPGGELVAVEPQGATNANNEYQSAVHESVEAEYNARLQLSQAVASIAEEMRNNLEAVGITDAIASRARMAESLNGVQPEMTLLDTTDAEVSGLEVQGMRHPLLEHKQQLKQQKQYLASSAKKARRSNAFSKSEHDVVPIDLYVGGRTGKPITILTGPNAGGKTAALKSAGLAALMARAGMFIPARRAHVPLLEPVMADIQSQQDLSIGLSRFSARVVQAKHMLKAGGPDALALIDELGAGTSPEEGAALGTGLLMELLRSKSIGLAIATAHHVGLASLSTTDERFMTAAIEFDEDNLTPTHKLLWGVPGRSRALELARRKHLPESIVHRAEELLPTGRIDLDKVSKELEQLRSSALRDEREADRLEEENSKLRARLHAARAASARRSAKHRAKIARNIGREAQRVSEQVKRERTNKRKTNEGESHARSKNKSLVEAGDEVQLITSGIRAVVAAVNDDGTFNVWIGSLNLFAKPGDVKLISKSAGSTNGIKWQRSEHENPADSAKPVSKKKKKKKRKERAALHAQRKQDIPSKEAEQNDKDERGEENREDSPKDEEKPENGDKAENSKKRRRPHRRSGSLAEQLQQVRGRSGRNT